MKLTAYEWNILDELQDQDEPFEIIDSSLHERFEKSTPQNLLEAILKLYRLGFVSIKQMPIKPLGQKFKERDIKPREAMECFGDLRAEYERYLEDRNAALRLSAGGKAAREPAVPLGIWIDITDLGQDEFDSDEYSAFWSNEPVIE